MEVQSEGLIMYMKKNLSKKHFEIWKINLQNPFSILESDLFVQTYLRTLLIFSILSWFYSLYKNEFPFHQKKHSQEKSWCSTINFVK